VPVGAKPTPERTTERTHVTTSSRARGGPVRRRRRRTLVGLGGAAGLVLLLTGCSPQDLPSMLDMPQPMTAEGHRIYSLWQGSWVAAWVVGAITWGLILWAAIAYRRRSDAVPVQVRYNLPIEVLYTFLPLVVIGVLFGFTARDQSELLKVDKSLNNTVNVVAFRWNWTFNYLSDNVYDVGSPSQLPTLYLKVNQPVRFELTSPDVIHSFWVPDFLFKMDVIPGKTNQFQITPDHVGTFAGRCAELCGVDHSRMLFNVKVVTEADYAAHVADLRARGQTGSLNTGRTTTVSDNDAQGRTEIGGSQ
jgi:cytochrome c oxidase subunit 2